MFLDAPPTEKGETFLEGVRKVEFRTDETVEEEFREEVERRERVGTLNEHERRITSLIVFVDEDGSERRLIEE